MTVADAPEQVERSFEGGSRLGPLRLIAIDYSQSSVGIGLPGGVSRRVEMSQAPQGRLPCFSHPPNLQEEYGIQLAGRSQVLLIVQELKNGDRLLESRRRLRIPAEVPVGPGEIAEGSCESSLVRCRPARLHDELMHVDPVL